MKIGTGLLWPRSPVWSWSVAGFLMAAPQVALAGDDIRASADVSTTGGYSSNPFAGIGPNLGSPYVQVSADPEVRLIAERSVLALKGHVNYQHYFKRYSDASDYQGGLDYAGTLTSRLMVHGNASYDSAIIGGFDSFNPTQTVTPPTTATDLALFGTQTRRRAVNLAGDLAYTLSARDSVTANGFYNNSKYGGFAPQSNYVGYGGGAGYSRRISDHLQLGAQASVSRYVYQGLFGQSQVYSLQTTISDDFTSRWSLKGSVGASYSDRTIGGTTISPTGNLQLCRISERANICATVSEAVLPSGYAGTVVTQSVGASYSYQLSEHSRFALSANYSHNNQPARIVAVNRIDIASSYLAASATYDRTLRERLHFLATARYRDITGGGGNRPADFGGTIGFSVRLGEYK